MLPFLFRNSKFTTRFIHVTDLGRAQKDNGKKGKENPTTQNDSLAFSIRHNFHEECEEGLNEQINCELYASYTYFCMATCLSRPDVALFGFAKLFSAASREEQEHARTLVDFVNMRGGTVQLSDVIKPELSDYHNPEVALTESISLEKNILKNLEELHKKATDHNDVLLCDLLESQYLPEQYKGIEQLAALLARVRRAGPGLGLIVLDLDLKNNPSNMHVDNK